MRRLITFIVIAIATVWTAIQVSQFYEAAEASQAGRVLFGVSMAGIVAAFSVIFEAIFYPAARLYYRNGSWVTGTLFVFALLLVIGYTFNGDLEANVTGRADRSAERAAAVDTRSDLRREIDALRQTRSTWTTKLSDNIRPSEVKDINARIDRVNERISSLQDKMEKAPTNSGASPAPQFMSDHFGQTVSFWIMFFLSCKLLFPAFMRAFAWELAFSTIDLSHRRRAPGNIGLIDTALTVAPVELAPVTAPEAMKELAPKEAKPKAKPAALKAVAGQSRTVLPFLPAGARPNGLSSIPAIVNYVVDGLREGRNESGEIYREVQHLARQNGFSKPGKAFVGGLVAKRLGNSRRDGRNGNRPFYIKRKAPREVKIA